MKKGHEKLSGKNPGRASSPGKKKQGYPRPAKDPFKEIIIVPDSVPSRRRK